MRSRTSAEATFIDVSNLPALHLLFLSVYRGMNR